MEFIKDITYNPNDESSIVAHAIKLLGNSLHDLYPSATKKDGKGNIGNAVESIHFGLKINNRKEPDFDNIGLELKTTALDSTKGGYVAGERLVIGLINFIEEAKAKSIEESHFWAKARMIIVFYLREKGKEYLDFIFQMIRLWEIPETDLRILIEDWNVIHNKLVNGMAHELHEGDTHYLGTCTKGDKDSKLKRQFKPNAPLVFPRAYCLKKNYMKWIVVDSFLKNCPRSTSMMVTDSYINRIRKEKEQQGYIITDNTQYKPKQTFDEYVTSQFEPYIGLTLEEICQKTKRTINYCSKDYGYATALAILKVNKKRIAEFEKAGVLLKTIRLNHGCKSIQQHMSFPAIDWIKLAEEEAWTESTWYQTINNRFFFVVFERAKDDKTYRRDEDKSSCIIENRKKMILKGVFFWSINNTTEEECKKVWLDTREKVRLGIYDNFIGVGQNQICHVRPHDTKALYNASTPQNTKEKKKCFWFKNKFIYSIVKANLQI